MRSDVTLLRDFCTEFGFYYYQTRESLDFQNLIDDAFNGVGASDALKLIKLAAEIDAPTAHGEAQEAA